MTMSHPDNSSRWRPGRAPPYVSNFLIQSPLATEADQMRLDRAAQDALLRFDRLGGVHHAQAEFLHQVLVLVENVRLENAIRLLDVRREPQIHAGFVVLEPRSSGENAAQRHFQ